MPCTTILVGKKASYDGSTMIARNDDSPSGQFTPKKFDVVHPEEQPKKYTSVLSHVEIDLPAQRLVVYQDGTPVADTGISAGSGTETGVYMVGEMKSPAEVNGGTVNFWIPYEENAGILDNPNLTQSDVGFWEEGIPAVSDFGSGESSTDGGIWTDNSGYIEIPGDMASEVYQNVRSGMPVVIYK